MALKFCLLTAFLAAHSALAQVLTIDPPTPPHLNPSVYGGGVTVRRMENGAINPPVPPVAGLRVPSPTKTESSAHLHVTKTREAAAANAPPGYGYPIGEVFPMEEYQRRKRMEQKHLAEVASFNPRAAKATIVKKPPCKRADMHGQPAAGMNYKDLYNVKYSDKGPYGYVQKVAGGTETQTVSLVPPLKIKEEQQPLGSTALRKIRRLGEVLGDFSTMIINKMHPISLHEEAPADQYPVSQTGNTPFHYAPPEQKAAPILGFTSSANSCSTRTVLMPLVSIAMALLLI